jgi:hypothetical protein
MKHLSGFVALFLCAALPLYAAGLDDLTWTTTNGEVTITDCDTDATDELVIPDTIDGNPVTSIGDQAFYRCESLTGITIPDSVTSIGEGAFYQCRSLTNITIPDSVTNIEGYAFSGCNSLTSITIPDGVTCIENEVFFGCTSLTSITIPDGVTSIGGGAFSDCTSLAGITIPESVTSIGDYTFSGCTSLTSITISDGVTSIGEGAFQDCTSLLNIAFQGAAPASGLNAFTGVPDEAVTRVTSENLESFRWNGLNVSTADQSDAIAQIEGQLIRLTAERDAAIEERDARFTEDQIRALSADYTIGLNDAGNVQMKFNIFESADLNTFAPLTLNPDSVSVVDGSICLEFTPEDRAAFFRFSVQ